MREHGSERIGGLLVRAERLLRRAGIDTARWEAECLLEVVLEVDRAGLLARLGEQLSAEQSSHFASLLERRARREPLQYLLGRWEFCGRGFVVDPRALIPRPETELLIRTLTARLGDECDSAVADVGTGSGVIAISLALERPSLGPLWAIDSSQAALEVAAQNIALHRVSDRVRLCRGELLGALEGLQPAHSLGLVVANLPYVSLAEYAGLAPELAHEPPQALVAGAAGDELIRRLIEQAPEWLERGGWLALETGERQAPKLRGLLERKPWREAELLLDDAGLPRVLLARLA